MHPQGIHNVGNVCSMETPKPRWHEPCMFEFRIRQNYSLETLAAGCLLADCPHWLHIVTSAEGKSVVKLPSQVLYSDTEWVLQLPYLDLQTASCSGERDGGGWGGGRSIVIKVCPSLPFNSEATYLLLQSLLYFFPQTDVFSWSLFCSPARSWCFRFWLIRTNKTPGLTIQ